MLRCLLSLLLFLQPAPAGMLLPRVQALHPAESAGFTLAGLKLLPARWDKAANFAKLDAVTRRAVSAGAEFIVTPEGYLEGYVGNAKMNPGLTRERYLDVAEPLDGPWMRKVEALAGELRIHMLVGFAERRGQRVFNSIALIGPDGNRIGLYSKTHTGGQEPFNDQGAEFPVFDTSLGRFGLLVCFDRQLPETSRILAIKGAQMILVPAFGLGTEEINEDVMMRTRAYENGVYVAHVHPKNTFVVDPSGTIIAQNRGESEGIVLAKITFDGRVGKGPIRHRRPGIYREILDDMR
ncbi:MAG: carbon-nitrogen hydrolase family protein [Acidobacteria bacterium]|nr:carbon-nitrogen hydrolase family protein [Acidobacteriota bacterium]